MKTKKLTPLEYIQQHSIWTETGITYIQKERRGPKIYIVFTLENGEKLSIQGRDLATYAKTMPLIYEATGYTLEKPAEASEWRQFAGLLHRAAGDEIIVSSDTDSMAELMRAWLRANTTQHAERADVAPENESISGLVRTLHEGKLDALSDAQLLIFRLPSLMEYVRRMSQGYSRDDVVGILYQMGYERKRIRDARVWLGPMV